MVVFEKPLRAYPEGSPDLYRERKSATTGNTQNTGGRVPGPAPPVSESVVARE